MMAIGLFLSFYQRLFKTRERPIILSRGGSTSIYKPYSAVSPQRVGFLRRFGLKTGLDFANFGLDSGMGF